MSRNLIDRDALIASIPKTNVDIFENCRNCSTLCDWQVKELIDKMPTIDAVEVVRCHKCCYWDRETIRYQCNDFKSWNEAVCRQHSIDGNEPHEMWVDADWFCADGEVKKDEQTI